MKLKSRGLGRKELVMDFREYDVHVEDGELVISGTIHEPVHWDFQIRMCEDDVPGVARVALRRATIGMLLKASLKRKKRSHWTNGRDEHLAQVKTRRAEAAAKKAEAKKAEKAEADAKVVEASSRRTKRAESGTADEASSDDVSLIEVESTAS